MSTLESLKLAVIEGKVAVARQLTEEAVVSGVKPDDVFAEALSPAMEEVGRLMQRSEYYIPEVLISAKAMKASTAVLRPLIAELGSARSAGTVVIGTAKGDLHDIGKSLVIMMLEGAGFRVVDLGTDVSHQRFVEAVREHQPQVVGISALLTTTMMQMADVVRALEQEGLRSKVKVMVGGAPVNHRFSDEIGADGFGRDASSAIELARSWVQEM